MPTARDLDATDAWVGTGIKIAEAGGYSEVLTVATMLHVVDHATYHRGQINSMLKQAGARPAAPYFQRYLASRAAGG